MYTAVKDGNVYFLTEWRLCCQCFRMFALNKHSYLTASCEGKQLWQHYSCPDDKPEPKEKS